MKKLLFLSLVSILAVSCSNVRGVKTAAYVGSALALNEHPEWKDAFLKAHNDLAILEEAETIGLPEIMAILNRLPVKELQSKEARIAIVGTTLLIEEIGSPAINVETVNKLRPIVKQLREGIKLALDAKFSQYNSEGKLIVRLDFSTYPAHQ